MIKLSQTLCSLVEDKPKEILTSLSSDELSNMSEFSCVKQFIKFLDTYTIKLYLYFFTFLSYGNNRLKFINNSTNLLTEGLHASK